jgi:hypothetical protein
VLREGDPKQSNRRILRREQAWGRIAREIVEDS